MDDGLPAARRADIRRGGERPVLLDRRGRRQERRAAGVRGARAGACVVVQAVAAGRGVATLSRVVHDRAHVDPRGRRCGRGVPGVTCPDCVVHGVGSRLDRDGQVAACVRRAGLDERPRAAARRPPVDGERVVRAAGAQVRRHRPGLAVRRRPRRAVNRHSPARQHDRRQHVKDHAGAVLALRDREQFRPVRAEGEAARVERVVGAAEVPGRRRCRAAGVEQKHVLAVDGIGAARDVAAVGADRDRVRVAGGRIGPGGGQGRQREGADLVRGAGYGQHLIAVGGDGQVTQVAAAADVELVASWTGLAGSETSST